MWRLRIAKGVLRSWAAEARAFVVLRERSRNCSSSRAISSAELGAETRAVAVDGRPSFGLVPVGAAAGLLSNIGAMENQISPVIGEGDPTTVRRGGTFDPMSGALDCQLETTPNRHRSEKRCTFLV